MELLEEYHELIERDSGEISLFWKSVQIFLYFLCASIGYASSILFYIFWHEIFGGNCPFWAVPHILPRVLKLDDASDTIGDVSLYMMRQKNKDWKNYIGVAYEYETRCKIYFFTSLFSCICGITWLTLFLICGKGGYSMEIFYKPWRVVVPALVFNFIFMLITLYTAHDMELGYLKFNNDMQHLFSKISDVHKPNVSLNECEIMQSYADLYNISKHDVCYIFALLQSSSLIMMWSWIGGFILLILRILLIIDFRLLKVRIYEIQTNIGSTNNVYSDRIEYYTKNTKDKKE